MEIRDYRHR